jgi:hypothetical protein
MSKLDLAVSDSSRGNRGADRKPSRWAWRGLGITPPPGERGPLMPSFAGAFTDQQIADVLGYARARAGRRPAWNDLGSQVKAIRQGQSKT